MFGRKPCLSIDMLFGTNTTELQGNTSAKYVENLEWAYKTANEVVRRNKNGINDIMIRKSDAHN